ncbi:hypothetical protein J1N35_037637 [Gossypium stocksii]|uniref:RNase H type-1 domain-containing protein n=1 Tax=Gossypium stocksii TaxID=47602 RepID=A0A9D3UKS3_9ROSI|nr:hypothetical protein J1N35_037637 [Gossypium stocksii]
MLCATTHLRKSGEFDDNDCNVLKYAILCWILWKNRNCFIFQQTISRPEEITRRINCFVASIKESMIQGDVMNDRQEEAVKWRSLSHGWVKINMDRFTSMTDNWSAAGGVIRDSLGNWKEGFRKHLARCSIPNVELWAILCSLEVARLRDIEKLLWKGSGVPYK